MEDERYWNRPTKKIKMDQYIVGFIDILNFKGMLNSKSFRLINKLFEEIADSIYSLQRKNYLIGLDKVEPNIVNFSDSIIIYQKIFSKRRKDYIQINHFIFSIFQTIVRDIIAASLKLKIPMRGGVSIGGFYAGKAMSITPQKVHRGPQIVPYFMLKEFKDKYDPPEVYKNKIIPPFIFPVHFGEALTEAYLLESGVNSIGIFMEPSVKNNPYLSQAVNYAIMTKAIIEIEIDGNKLLAFNWCNRIDYEIYKEIEDYIEKQINKYEPHISDKWEYLLNFTKIAPKR